MRILMVCLGNICRSPLAEGIMQQKIAQRNLDWSVDSAGTSNYHVNHAPDERSIAIASKNNIDIQNLRGRQFSISDFSDFDLILPMDSMNYMDIIRLSPNEEMKDKVQLIMNYVEPGKNIAVPDPYFGGSEGFENVFRMLDQACEKVIERYPGST